MYLITFSTISVVLPCYILIELIRIHLLKKERSLPIPCAVSLTSVAFGIFLTATNSFILDFGSTAEILLRNAKNMWTMGVFDILTGSLFILISILKWGFRKPTYT